MCASGERRGRRPAGSRAGRGRRVTTPTTSSSTPGSRSPRRPVIAYLAQHAIRVGRVERRYSGWSCRRFIGVADGMPQRHRTAVHVQAIGRCASAPAPHARRTAPTPARPAPSIPRGRSGSDTAGRAPAGETHTTGSCARERDEVARGRAASGVYTPWSRRPRAPVSSTPVHRASSSGARIPNPHARERAPGGVLTPDLPPAPRDRPPRSNAKTTCPQPPPSGRPRTATGRPTPPARRRPARARRVQSTHAPVTGRTHHQRLHDPRSPPPPARQFAPERACRWPPP